MDPRCNKPRDFNATFKNLTEYILKNRSAQMKWLQNYEWLINEHLKLQEDLTLLCKEKAESANDASVVRDNRTCLPFPITSNNEYGWLATRSSFELEKYGSYIVKYPDPLGDIPPITGNIPTLAGGKGYIR